MRHETDHKAVVKMLTQDECKPVDIHARKLIVFGEACVSFLTVRRRAIMFSDCWQKTTDLPLSGQAPKVVTETLITDIDSAIKENRRQIISDVTTEFNVSIGNMFTIVFMINRHHSREIHNLPKQWNGCLNTVGDFFLLTNFACISLIKYRCFVRRTGLISVSM